MGGQRNSATREHHASLPRLVAAGAAFVLIAVASALPPGILVDQAVTTGLQHTIPHARTAHVAARLVYLGNAAVMIPGLTVIGLGLWLAGDGRHGIATLVLTAAMVCASLSAGMLEHVIAHPGPPEALKLHFPREADDPLISLVSIGHIVGLIAALVAVRFVVLLLTSARRSIAAWLPLAVVVGLGLVALGLRHVVTGLPPAVAEWVNRYAVYGYPSGHVARTTLLVSTALRRVPLLGVLVVALMMASLVYLGDHWLSEAVGGFCLGWVFVELARCRWPLPGRPRPRSA
jgi:membrane-associated phospholipid phosphatase